MNEYSYMYVCVYVPGEAVFNGIFVVHPTSRPLGPVAFFGNRRLQKGRMDGGKEGWKDGRKEGRKEGWLYRFVEVHK